MSTSCAAPTGAALAPDGDRRRRGRRRPAPPGAARPRPSGSWNGMTPGSTVTWVACRPSGRAWLPARPWRPAASSTWRRPTAARCVPPRRGTPPARGAVRLVGEPLVVRVGRDGRTTADAAGALVARACSPGHRGRVAARAAGAGGRPGRIAIRDQSSRWASASPARHALVQLAPYPGAARGARRGRRPRARAPARARPLAGLLGARRAARPADARRATLAARPRPGGPRRP